MSKVISGCLSFKRFTAILLFSESSIKYTLFVVFLIRLFIQSALSCPVTLPSICNPKGTT